MTTTSPTTHAPTTDAHDASGHDHPSDLVFVKVALILGVLTAIEVFTYFESVHHMKDWMIITLLCVLMVVKFYLVVAYFMHLKYDNPIFTKMFSFGLFLAIPIYFIMFFAFNQNFRWDDVPDGMRAFFKVCLVALPPIVAFAALGLRRKNPSRS